MNLYHINRTFSWGGHLLRKGDEIFVGNQLNPFYKRFFHGGLHHPMMQPNETEDEFFGRIDANKILPPDDFANFASSSISHYKKLARELLFEECRLKTNSQMPSRQACLFMADQESLNQWTTMLKPHTGTQAQILICEVEKFQKVDSLFIDLCRHNSIGEWWKMAKRYWSNEYTDSPRWEYLVVGKVKVVDIIYKIDG